jgi:hypothetical protein
MATVRQNWYVWDALVETANEIILFLQQNEDGHDEDDQRTFEGGKDRLQHARARESGSDAGCLTSTGIGFRSGSA